MSSFIEIYGRVMPIGFAFVVFDKTLRYSIEKERILHTK